METKQESQVITTFNIVDRQLTKQEQYLEDYHCCPLCGTEMEFTHTTHFVKSEAAESAHCPSCNINIKQDTYKLQ